MVPSHDNGLMSDVGAGVAADDCVEFGVDFEVATDLHPVIVISIKNSAVIERKQLRATGPFN